MTVRDELTTMRAAKLADIEQVERHAAQRRWDMQAELEVIMSRRELYEIERVGR